MRNLGYSRNAGEFVKRWFGDIGSAGGHRAMAKAVVPIDRFRQKFGDLSGPRSTARIAEMAEQFLHEPAAEKKKEAGRRGQVYQNRAPSPQRLIQIRNQIVRIFEPDRQARHAVRDAGALELLVRVAPLRGQHRQAAQAFDAAQAGGALEHLQPIEEARRALEAAAEVDADHAAEAAHLLARHRVIGM